VKSAESQLKTTCVFGVPFLLKHPYISSRIFGHNLNVFMKKLYSIRMLKRALLAMAFCLPASLFAQDSELAPVSRTLAITNVNIVQAPGRKIDMGTVVLKDGLILSVGKNVSIPADAIVIKADSMYVYAGFIDGLSHVGIPKPKEEPNGPPRPKDPGNPKPEEAGITPQVDVRSSLNPWDKSVEELRNVGFTTAHVVPYGGMMPGSGAIVLLSGKSADEMVLVNKSSFYSELTPAQRSYPGTVMGVMAKYRELYRQAALSRSYENAYASNRAGIQRPTTDRTLESLYPVIDKKLPVLFKAERVMDAQRVLTLQSDLGFNLLLAELKEGWDIVNKVKGSNAKVFLSLDLPEEKKDDKKEGEGEKKEDKAKSEEKKEKETKKEDKPKTPADLEKAALEKRKEDFIAKYVGQAAVYQKAGVKYGFSTMSAKASDIKSNLGRMIKAGLSEDAALASLTTAPAELLGLSDRMGSVDNGKIANLVISDKPYFNEKSKVRYVVVDGTLYKLETKEPKKADANAKDIVSGSWSMSTEADRVYSSTVVLKKDGNTVSGTISGDLMPQAVDLKDVSIDGNKLSFSYTVNFGGGSLDVSVEGTIDGDDFKGSSSTTEYGSFPVKGKRNPK
jgi:imidazolonepropionase-like amidohydrolase